MQMGVQNMMKGHFTRGSLYWQVCRI